MKVVLSVSYLFSLSLSLSLSLSRALSLPPSLPPSLPSLPPQSSTSSTSALSPSLSLTLHDCWKQAPERPFSRGMSFFDKLDSANPAWKPLSSRVSQKPLGGTVKNGDVPFACLDSTVRKDNQHPKPCAPRACREAEVAKTSKTLVTSCHHREMWVKYMK